MGTGRHGWLTLYLPEAIALYLAEAIEQRLIISMWNRFTELKIRLRNKVTLIPVRRIMRQSQRTFKKVRSNGNKTPGSKQLKLILYSGFLGCYLRCLRSGF